MGCGRRHRADPPRGSDGSAQSTAISGGPEIKNTGVGNTENGVAEKGVIHLKGVGETVVTTETQIRERD